MDQNMINQESMRNQNQSPKKSIKQALIPWIVAIFIVGAFVFAFIWRWRSDIKNYPEEKLEAFLEECLMQDVHVTMDHVSYFTEYLSSEYIPYIGQTTLKDGSSFVFTVQWERDRSLDYGVYTEYGDELAEYYLDKYGISNYTTSTWVEVDVTEAQLAGENPILEQCLMDIWESDYVQSGQDLVLYLTSDIGHSYHLEMNWEWLPYDEIEKQLTALKK